MDYKTLEQSSTTAVMSTFAENPEGRKLHQLNFMISQNKVAHSRRVYNILDLIGEFGGVPDLIFYAFLVMWLKKHSKFSFVLKSVETLYSSEWVEIFKDAHFWPLYIRTQTIFGRCMRAPSSEVQKLSELYQEGKEKLDKDLLLDGILQKIKKTWRVTKNK